MSTAGPIRRRPAHDNRFDDLATRQLLRRVARRIGAGRVRFGVDAVLALAIRVVAVVVPLLAVAAARLLRVLDARRARRTCRRRRDDDERRLRAARDVVRRSEADDDALRAHTKRAIEIPGATRHRDRNAPPLELHAESVRRPLRERELERTGRADRAAHLGPARVRRDNRLRRAGVARERELTANDRVGRRGFRRARNRERREKEREDRQTHRGHPFEASTNRAPSYCPAGGASFTKCDVPARCRRRG